MCRKLKGKRKEKKVACVCSAEQEEEKVSHLVKRRFHFFNVVKSQKQVFQWDQT